METLEHLSSALTGRDGILPLEDALLRQAAREKDGHAIGRSKHQMSGDESNEQVGDAAELRSMKAMDELEPQSIHSTLLCNNALRVAYSSRIEILISLMPVVK